MKKILILKHQKREDAESPEFSYLLSDCLLQVKRLFKLETLIWNEQNSDIAIPDSDYVLVLGKENIFFSSETLRHMCNSLSPNTGVVLPDSLSSFKLSHTTPIYSVRGYESVEDKILKASHQSIDANKSHLPISLFSANVFRNILKTNSLSEVFANKELLRDINIASKIVNTGVYHQYIDYYAEPREDILQYIPETAKNVLEVGCGRGITGKMIEEKFGCCVTGVELNPLAALDAKNNISRVIVGNIQELELEDKYDAVVATELFEHLNYPEDFLIKMKNILNPGGSIILSTPNVGHYSVVEDLAAGRWDYVPIGLLCYTHFRFFTYKTLVDYIERVGFSSYEIIQQKTELPRRFRFLKYINSNDIDLESLSTKGFYVVLKV
ncbi:MAG: hypothetical protein DHS20C13_06540 [Thermodesulfobacteriota bacterium]|nr:MAG: hypothetical protein DHS20C13_06540 [Thermodesulfobacteriota bacterium]